MLPPGTPFFFLIQIGLDVVDEGIDFLGFVGVDHQTGALVHQQQVLIFVDNIHFRLE